MTANAKYTAQGLVVSKKSPIFALPNQRNSANQDIVDRTLWAYSRSTSALRGCAGLATWGIRPLCIYSSTTFDEQCQIRSKVVGRSIVTLPHRAWTTACSLIERFFSSISNSPISFGSKFTDNRRRLLTATLRLSRPAHRLWRLVQQSSSSSVVVFLSALTGCLSCDASSRNAKTLVICD